MVIKVVFEPFEELDLFVELNLSPIAVGLFNGCHGLARGFGKVRSVRGEQGAGRHELGM
jgi:hypothetical protein